VQASDAGVDISLLSGGTFFDIASPPIGVWSVLLTGSGNFTLKVSADSSLSFDFAFAEYGGRPDHSGWGPITDSFDLVAGETYPALAFLEGSDTSNATDVSFTVRSGNGDVFVDDTTTGLISGSGEPGFPPLKSYFGMITIPPRTSGLSWIYVTGKDSTGNSFMRVFPNQILPVLSNNTSSLNSTTTNRTSGSTTLPPFPYANASTSTKTATTPPSGLGSLSTGFPTSPSTGPAGHSDVITVIQTIYTTVCPITTTITSGGQVTTITTSINSTISKTFTSIIPCSSCTGPNYPSISASSIASSVGITAASSTAAPTTAIFRGAGERTVGIGMNGLVLVGWVVLISITTVAM